MATLSIKPISEIKQALAKLAEQPRDGKVKSMLGAIKLLAEDVRSLVGNGYTYAEIADILSQQGLPISASTLRSYMSRINAARSAQGQPMASADGVPAPLTDATKRGLDATPQPRGTGQPSSASSATFRPVPDSEII